VRLAIGIMATSSTRDRPSIYATQSPTTTPKAFRPAPYKLIPFDPVPVFLTIASFAIFVNLLVLLAVLFKGVWKPRLEEYMKRLISSAEKECTETPRQLSQRSEVGSYEMDVCVGSSRSSVRPPRRRVPIEHWGENDPALAHQVWGPGGAAMRDSLE
jgi:hypothetical protein